MTARRYTVSLTQAQLDALVSFAEMVDARSPCTFAEWATANPGSLRSVRAAELVLRTAENTKP